MIYYYGISQSLNHNKGVMEMGTIVCQTCNSTIGHFEDEKVTTLYGKCTECCNDEVDENE